jgi:RNA polymerase sigma factor, sigma-70 family
MKYEINDYELISQVRENNEDAILNLYSKYTPIINSVTNKFNQSNNMKIDYDDIKQEANIALYNAIKNYDPDSGSLFYTYAVLCINKRLISYCKKNYNYISKLGLEYLKEEKMLSYYDYMDESHYKFLNNYYGGLTRDIINMLPDDLSLIFELKYNGFSNKEIANLLDTNSKYIENSVRKVRNQIKRSSFFKTNILELR